MHISSVYLLSNFLWIISVKLGDASLGRPTSWVIKPHPRILPDNYKLISNDLLKTTDKDSTFVEINLIDSRDTVSLFNSRTRTQDHASKLKLVAPIRMTWSKFTTKIWMMKVG